MMFTSGRWSKQRENKNVWKNIRIRLERAFDIVTIHPEITAPVNMRLQINTHNVGNIKQSSGFCSGGLYQLRAYFTFTPLLKSQLKETIQFPSTILQVRQNRINTLWTLLFPHSRVIYSLDLQSKQESRLSRASTQSWDCSSIAFCHHQSVSIEAA